MQDRVIVALTGATGQKFGITALEILEEQPEIETHLIISDAAKINIQQESDMNVSDIQAMSDQLYKNNNIGASIASGSFETEGMLIVPCSMKTLSNIAHSNSGNLITRAADVTLKERRPLVVMPREKPLNHIHIKNMLKITEAGGIIFPPLLSFYQNPKSIDEMIRRTMIRSLNKCGLNIEFDEWKGLENPSEAKDKL